MVYNKKIILYTILNLCVFTALTVLCIINNKSDLTIDFDIISFKINSRHRFLLLILSVYSLISIDILTSYLILPNINQIVFNPDKKIVYNISKLPLEICTNILHTIYQLKPLLYIYIVVKYNPLIIYMVGYSLLLRMLCIHIIIRSKSFEIEFDKDACDEEFFRLL